jgi:hypothetical protein
MFPFQAKPIVLLGILLLSACLPIADFFTTPTSVTPFPQSTATAIKILPTLSSPGDSVVWRDLQVSMDRAEITEGFTNEFGSQRNPSAGQKFLWVHVALRNVGQDEVRLPEPENFSALYAESEFKPVYGHRQGYADYSDLSPTLFPGQEADAWLRFDIPEAADLNELWFVFLPTSAQVGSAPSSPTYPYAVNKPTFVWKCEP